jgi:lysozyme
MDRKKIFDAVRRMLGRGFDRHEVDALDAAIDQAVGPPDNADGNTVTHAPRTIGERGLALLKTWEGCAKRRDDGLIEAYPDPGTGGAPWTIGWGSTGRDIARGTLWTQAQCDARLEADLVRFAREVERAIAGAPTSEAQFDALVCFHYNTGAIARASLTRKHRSGDFAGAEQEFSRWVHAGGRVLRGLQNRRRAEAGLYASD